MDQPLGHLMILDLGAETSCNTRFPHGPWAATLRSASGAGWPVARTAAGGAKATNNRRLIIRAGASFRRCILTRA